MLANPTVFGIVGATPDDQALCAWAKLERLKKSKFALRYAIDETSWTAPGYILDGLRWLAAVGVTDADAEFGQTDIDVPEAATDHDG